MKMPTNPEAAAKRGPKAAWLWSRRKWEYLVNELKQGRSIDEDLFETACALCYANLDCKRECISCGDIIDWVVNTNHLVSAEQLLAKIVAKGIDLGYWTE